MSKKIAIVTGANKGIGLSLVKLMCPDYEGKVYLTSRDEGRGLEACDSLKKLGLNPTYHQLDITDEKSIRTFIAHIQNNKEEVDILVNNAAIMFLEDAKDSKVVQAEQTIFVNFTALVNFTEMMLPLVIKDGGKIINVSSSAGHLSRIPSDKLKKQLLSNDLSLAELISLMNGYVEAVRRGTHGEEGWGESAYVVSKVGVNCYTLILHRKLSPGIKVNCMHPGYVRTALSGGQGRVSADEAAPRLLPLVLRPAASGQFMWHDGTFVSYDGPDPRTFIDRMNHL